MIITHDTHPNISKLEAIEKFAKKLNSEKELFFKWWAQGYNEKKYHNLKRYNKIKIMLQNSEKQYQILLNNYEKQQ